MTEQENQPTLAVVRGADLDAQRQAAIIRLCEHAFADDFSRLFARRPGAVHIVAHLAGVLVGHACWGRRALRPEGAPRLQAAWISAVAIEPSYQGQGIGQAVMRRVAGEIQGYDLGALTAAVVPFYERLGWEVWRGTVTERSARGQLRPPDEPVMILRLPRTPPLALDAHLTIEPRQASLAVDQVERG